MELLREKDCMKKTKMKSYAKINLYFELVNKRQDGYHDIKSILQNIDIFDEIEIEEIERGIKIDSNYKDIPVGADNTVYKAVNLIIKTYKIDKGIKIFLNKNIPHSAGLGGGSSDSAAVIEALNRLWNLKMSTKDKEEIAGEIGTDVYFFLKGGTVYVEDKGDKTRKVKDFKWDNILLVKPDFDISTPFIYSRVKNEHLSKDYSKIVLEKFSRENEKSLIKFFKNDLEKAAEREYPEIYKIKKEIIGLNAEIAMMSGSGSSVFGLFKDRKTLDKAYSVLDMKYDKVYKTKTIERGFDYEG
jgi:4-diphosphocytidyl-2-C-methyl-D-erythritol kinase